VGRGSACAGQTGKAIAKGKLKGALARALRARRCHPDDLPAMIEAALTRAFSDRLGLEMRSGRC
jgi:hypothetical protein